MAFFTQIRQNLPFRLRDNGDHTYNEIVVHDAPKGTKSTAAVAPTSTALLALAANTSRLNAVLYNNGVQTIYLGVDNTVTTSTGQPLAPGCALYDSDSSDAWYGIVASGTGDLRVTEVTRA
jgi:hypothetical protein